MRTCRGCGAEIIFIKTANGKAIPCDPGTVTYWERKGAKDKIVTPNGEVISCDYEGKVGKETGVGYIPHWATCPEADRFRKKEGDHETG